MTTQLEFSALVKFTMLFYCFAVIGCDKNENTDVFNHLLLGCWTHSYEENQDGEEVNYRPCDFKEFPNAWYREVYQFKTGGVCDYLVLAPNDAHFMQEANWTSNESGIIEITDSNKELVAKFSIESIEEDHLVLVKL